jgi:hypothetical protein
MVNWKKIFIQLFISSVLAVVLCNGCSTNAPQTALPQYAEGKLENGLMWMFEKGLPLYFSKVTQLEILASDDEFYNNLSTEEKALLSDHKYIESLLLQETDVSLGSNINTNDLYYLLSFRLVHHERLRNTGEGTSDYYNVSCYLRDIQDTVIEYWVVVGCSHWREYDKQLFFITVADTITAPRRVAIRSDQFVETAEVGGRTIQFPRDNLYILSRLDAKGFPLSYLNSDLADYEVVIEWEGDGNQRRPGNAYLKKIGRVGRFFYCWFHYERAFIGKSRIVKY